MSTFDMSRSIFALFLMISLFHRAEAFQFSEEYYEANPAPETKIAVLTLEGVLSSEMSELFVDQMTVAFKDPSIKAIVLKITSPGGSAGVSSALYYSLAELKKEYNKFVLVWVDNVCASGGYYIASAADWIVAAPGAMVGSIGVIYEAWRFKKLIEKFDIGHDVIHAGKFKAVGNPYTDMSEETRAYLDALLDGAYQTFIGHVRIGRPNLSADHTAWADGKIFSGTDALTKGLVDQIGAHQSIEKKLREKLSIEGFIRWVHPPRPRGHDNSRQIEEKNSFSLSELVKTLWHELKTHHSGLRMEYMP